MFYFTDAPSLAVDLVQGSAHPITYTTIAVLTLTTVVFGGFAREQVCIYMCPWPRIQAAMIDEDTITVGYRDWRGEPRGKHRKAEGAEQLDDCIDCMACVNVCPMGIDIRDGQQLACITCALCIDACDDVMTRIGKPRGLIDYLALSDEPAERAGKPAKPVWQHVFRLRTIIYTALWALVGIALVVALFIRSDIEVTVAPIRNPTFVTLSDGTIRNAYDLRLRNKLGEDRDFAISITGAEDLRIELEGAEDGVVRVPADETLLQRVYVLAPRGSAPALSERSDLRFWIADGGADNRIHKDSIFNGAGQ